MNESDWLTGVDPGPMLDYLTGRAGERKLRLAACACARRHFAQLSYNRCREAVEAAERFADGRLDAAALAAAGDAANFAVQDEGYYRMPAAGAAAACALPAAADALRTALLAYAQQAARDAVFECALPGEESAAAAAELARERRIQCGLLREVFGNPFRPPAVEEALRRWNDGCVVKLAGLIYERRRWDELPILADALAEAGCRDEELLAHCARPAGHALGCWALDALLGKS
jgi:hypothetical protein